MIPRECKRLAEVDFPIAEVSRHAVGEDRARKGHTPIPSTSGGRAVHSHRRVRFLSGTFFLALPLNHACLGTSYT